MIAGRQKGKLEEGVFDACDRMRFLLYVAVIGLNGSVTKELFLC